MIALLKDYLDTAEKLGVEPDATLLAPILKALEDEPTIDS